MLKKQLNLYTIPVEELCIRLKNGFTYYQYDYKRHLIHLENEGKESIGYVRLPLHVKLNDALDVVQENTQILYLTIESGNAAICIQKGKTTCYHTTFSAYMTRKKQGYSQIKYLNKKGKSRAGSRVRLASTIEFFEKINTKLTMLLEEYEVDRIAINCTPTLIPYLHQSKVACPFDKKDKRLYKIPLHLPQSNFTNLTATIKKLMAPLLFYDERFEEEVNVIVE